MNKLAACILLGVVLGMFCSLIGIPVHNYELNKCNSISASTNQEYYDYELQNNCYFVLEKPEWNLFWNCFILGLFGAIIFGLIGFAIYIGVFDEF